MKIKSVFQSGAAIAGMLIVVGCAGRNESEISGIVSQALDLPTFLPTGALPEKILPDGAVALDERYFPDETFREYLYQYYDQDKDYILTREESQVLFELGDVDYQGKTDEEKTEREELLKQVYSFEGITYLENLRTIVLGEEYVTKELHLNNPKLEEVVISCTGVKELSVEGAPGLKRLVCQECESTYILQDSVENLEELKICAGNPVELDLSGMQGLERVSLTNITADFSLLLQNKNLTSIYLQDCCNLHPQEEMDFSGLESLQNVRILMQEAPEEYWAKRMIFGDGFQNPYEWENWIGLRCGIAGQVVLGNKGVCCRIEGDEKACEIIYMDEIREAGQTLPEGNVWNGAENFQDLGLRRYLYYFFDTDKDNILTEEERGAVTQIIDTGYDYDATAAWNNENAWKIEDDVSQDIIGLTSLQGMEYFPMLRRLQLEKMALSAGTTEIVLNLPNLEILELRFNGNVKTIDLTACKNLRICVIDSDRDADFVQEVKPEILLPEHLQLETQPGLDCVVGVAGDDFLHGNDAAGIRNTENEAADTSINGESGEDKAVSWKVTKNAYFLDDNTLVFAKIPENWYGRGGEIHALDGVYSLIFTCIDTVVDGLRDTNAFCVKIGKASDKKDYSGYEQTTFQYEEGQTGYRYTKEERDDTWEVDYHMDELLSPDGCFVTRITGDWDAYITTERYNRNRQKIEAFYNSIVYQMGGDTIGNSEIAPIEQRDWVSLYIYNPMYLYMEMDVPEGISYKKEFFGSDVSVEGENLRIQFYLDDTKKNYIEVYSDVKGFFQEFLITDCSYRWDYTNHENYIKIYYENEQRGFLNYSCAFCKCGVAASVHVEKDKTELYELGKEILQTIKFPPEEL